MNPFTKNTIENPFKVIIDLSDSAKKILIHCMLQKTSETYNLKIDMLQDKVKSSKPTVIKGLKELKTLNIIKKADTKSNYYIHPDILFYWM